MANLAERHEPRTGNPRAIWAAIDEMRRTVDFLRSSRDTVGRATVDVGRNFIVKGLLKVIGDVSLVDAEGAELLRMGAMVYGRGLEMRRANGLRAFTLSKNFVSSTQQTWGFYDQVGAQILAENSVGPGLYRPFLELPFQPVAAASASAVSCGPYGLERATSSTSFVTLFQHDGKVQNAFLDFKFAAVCSDGSTAGQIQVVDLDTGVPLAGFFLPAWVGTIPAGTTTMTVIDPDASWVVSSIFAPTVRFGDPMRLGVQVKRTAGSGTITLAVPSAIGG